MKRIAAALVVASLGFLGVVTATDEAGDDVDQQEPAAATAGDIGPVPRCNGESATMVLVKFGTAGDYQAWAAQGVTIVEDPDNAMRGTWGHDVMVALVPTENGGLISEPLRTPDSPQASAGDFMCSLVPGANDIYYATHGRADVIIDPGGGNAAKAGIDNYFLGGCYLEPEGTVGDRKCDVLISKGDDANDVNRIWGFKVPKGRVQRITTSGGHDHNYVGAGAGRVVIDAGGNPTNVNGGGDHVHPCPVESSDPKFLSGLEGGYTKNKIATVNVEYFGPESEFLPLNQVSDPCAYQDRNLR